MTDQDLNDFMRALVAYWPGPPEWDAGRLHAYRQVLVQIEDFKDANDALYQLATEEQRRLCPPPAEFLAVAIKARERRREAQREWAREGGDDSRAIGSGGATIPSSWLTADRHCEPCGERLHLVMSGPGDARLHCMACNTTQVMDTFVLEQGVKKGNIGYRVTLTAEERSRLRTLPAPEPWTAEQIAGFKARVREAAGRQRGEGGLRSVGSVLGGLFPQHEGRDALWRRARMLERQGRQIDWSKLSGDGCLPVNEGHDYLAGISAPAATEGSA